MAIPLQLLVYYPFFNNQKIIPIRPVSSETDLNDNSHLTPMKKKFTTNYAPLYYSIFCLFFLCFSINLSAQITLDTAVTAITKTVTCSGNTTFTDNNLAAGGLYFDDQARKDTVILCPNTSGHQVKVTFTAFDVANGDVLTAFDGDIKKNSGATSQRASGNGVSNAFGGWVQADCNPANNPTGCLSFVFEVNGDKVKGNGWTATITCESSGIVVQCPANISVQDDCNNLDGMVMVSIPKPTFTTCSGTATSMVNITSNCTAITGGAVLADGGLLGNFTIPLGTYTITATSIADPTKTCTYFVFADQPSISCNDNVTSTIAFGCTSRITVDDILEGDPCFGSGVEYEIKLDLGDKVGIKTAKFAATNAAALNAGGLDIAAADFNCGTTYSVEIIRIVNFTGCGGITSVSNSCTGKIKFEDNSAPSISLSANTLTTCGNLTDAEIKSQLNITVNDNCDVKDTLVSIGAFPSNLCGTDLSIPVTVTAVDFCGNSNTETINVKIIRPTAFFRPADTVLTCGSGTGPAIAGYPLLDTDGDGKGDLPIIENTCNFIPIFTDQVVTANNSSTTKIFRTWQIKDWCNQAVPVNLTPQLIELKDTGKPVLVCPSGNQQGTENNPYTTSTNSSNCTGTITINTPTASDDCGGTVTVTLDRVINLANNSTQSTLSNLPVGKYYAVYVGRDDAGNRSDECRVYFNVNDSSAPQAFCVDALNVSFVNGFATIRVEDIDAGSNDNCGAITKEIRKEGGTWGQTVSLTCAEINNDGRITLRVTDSNSTQNSCWVQITGKDNSVPDCEPLDDQTVVCTTFHLNEFGQTTDSNGNQNFDESEWTPLTEDLIIIYNGAFGNPNCSSNSACSSAANIEQEYQIIAPGCGETQIKRRYRATDGGNNQSDWQEQLITVTVNQDFSITFPEDWAGTCGDNFPTANLNLANGGCSVLAWTHEDKRFDSTNDACYYIERTYSITNWCLHTVGATPEVIAREEDEHGFSKGKTVTNLTAGSYGAFEYVQILKVNDNTAPTIIVNTTDECLSGTDCMGEKTFSINANDCIGDQGLTYSYELVANGTVVKSGQAVTFSAMVTPTTYEIKWTVNDNCGNTATEAVTYNFKDCTRPNPFCLDGVATVIDANGKALVWATDLNQKSLDNCSAEANLEFRIYHPILAGTVTKPQSGDDGAVALALPKSVELDCNYLGAQDIELYVIDEAGNWDFCTGSVFVQDGSGACGSGIVDSNNVAMVAGGIITTNNIPLANVILTAKGTALYEQTITTDDSGIFELNLPKGIGYVISFDKEDDAANGMTVFDIIMVSKHILGITSFESDWQYIAADINNSGSISAFDLVLMRKIVLGIDTEFTNNTPWRFMPTQNVSINQTDILSLSETIVISELTENQTSLDYTAIKIGDLNGSAKVEGFTNATDRNTHNPLIISLKDQKIKKENPIKVTISPTVLATIQGLQMGLSFEGLTLESINQGQVQTQHIAQNTTNELTILWDKFSINKTASSTNNWLTLNFTATQDGQLSEFLQLSPNTQTEAVNIADEVSTIVLNFEAVPVSNSFNLYQNTPNPFADHTNIGFDLTISSEVTLDIFNLQGALLKQIKGQYEAGYHKIAIQKSDLTSNGVLIYQLTTPNGVVSRKMIVLD